MCRHAAREGLFPSTRPDVPASCRGLKAYIQTDIIQMKGIRFIGDSLKRLRAFPDDARQDAGYQLDKVQRGEQPDDFKPMPSIGEGVEEIRVRDEAGVFRVIYTARLRDEVVVLHAFQKKTRATSKRDLELARARWSQAKEQ
jgi:phage-related protein